MGSARARERAAGPPPIRERTLGRLFRELGADSSRLIRQEIGLARAEMRQALRALAGDVARLGIGSAVTGAGLLTLLAFAVALLGDLLGDRYRLAALIVALALLATGGLLLRRGLRRIRQREVMPRDTLDALRTTQRWARAEVRDVRAAVTGDGDRRRSASPPPGAAGIPVRPVHPSPAAEASPAPVAADRRPGTGAEDSLLKRVFREISADDIAGQAAKVAYYTFMALPSALLVLFSLTGLFGDAGAADWMTDQLESALPASAGALIHDFVQQVVHNDAPAPLSFGLALALWAASGAFMGFMVTLNRAYDVVDDRSFLKKRAIAVGTMIAFTALLLAASVALVAGPQIADALGPGSTGELVWNVAHWPLAFAFVVAAFWILYYLLPNRDQSACKGTLLKASAVAALLWVAATAGFRFYVANFGSYSETYGVLAGFILLLLWLYLTGLVVLAGGELASEMEQRA